MTGALDNPYWDTVAEHVTASDRPWEDGAPTVGNLLDGGLSRSLWDYITVYSRKRR